MFPFLLLVIALLTLAGCSDTTGPEEEPFVPVELSVELFNADVTRPTSMAAPPGDDSRLFVTEQFCCVRVIENGTLLPEPFLDLSGQLGQSFELGVASIAFHPEFETNGYVYVSYSNTVPEHVVERYTVSEADPNKADVSSAQLILATPQTADRHMGGYIAFGPEGYLWVSRGDGSQGGDNQGNGQNIETLLGAVSRIDVDAATPYAIPPDNPFVGVEGRDELWAYGLRNPWKLAFDAENDLVYLADVGANEWEEVNVVPNTEEGYNFGWSRMEGTHCFPPERDCDPGSYTLPVVEYGHDEGCSVIGGVVYRGSEIPDLQGHYIYTDFCGGWMRSFRFTDGEVRHEQEWILPSDVLFPTSFGVDNQGDLYLLTRGNDETKGRMFRVVETAGMEGS